MKNLKNLGIALSKAEQKNVFGGGRHYITHAGDPCYDRIEGKIPSGCPCTHDYECSSSTCMSNGICF